MPTILQDPRRGRSRRSWWRAGHPSPPDALLRSNVPGRWGSRTRPPGRLGFTLLEVATVLMVAAVALSLALPRLETSLDRASVRGAREAVVGMVGRARAESMASGGAVLGVSPAGDSVWVSAGGRTVARVHTGRDFGVDLGPAGAPDRALSFGFLGLGRAASGTVTFRRGEAEVVMTVSAYGRVKRW